MGIQTRGPAVGLLFFAWTAAAAEPSALRIDCQRLSREETSEVETRARAALLTAGLDSAAVELTCDLDRIRATLQASAGRTESARPLDDGAVPGQLMRALDAAIEQLIRAPAPEPPPPSSAVFTDEPAVAAPTPPPVEQAEERQPAPHRHGAPPLVPSRPFTGVAVGATLEDWGSRLAPGASHYSRLGQGRFGLVGGVSYHTAPSSQFRADELSMALGMDYRPPHAGGVTIEGDFGLSVLAVTPRAPYRPVGAAKVSAGFVRLLVARPVALGRLAIVPAAGFRIFSGLRRLRVEGEERLQLGYVVPQLGVSVSYILD